MAEHNTTSSWRAWIFASPVFWVAFVCGIALAHGLQLWILTEYGGPLDEPPSQLYWWSGSVRSGFILAAGIYGSVQFARDCLARRRARQQPVRVSPGEILRQTDQRHWACLRAMFLPFLIVLVLNILEVLEPGPFEADGYGGLMLLLHFCIYYSLIALQGWVWCNYGPAFVLVLVVEIAFFAVSDLMIRFLPGLIVPSFWLQSILHVVVLSGVIVWCVRRYGRFAHEFGFSANLRFASLVWAVAGLVFLVRILTAGFQVWELMFPVAAGLPFLTTPMIVAWRNGGWPDALRAERAVDGATSFTEGGC